MQTKMSLVTARTDYMLSLRCGDKLFHSPGLAAAKALSPTVLWVRVTTHVRLSVERGRRSRALAIRRESSAKYDAEFPDSDRLKADLCDNGNKQ